MLGRHWEHGRATIVERQVAEKGTYRYHVGYDYIADVQPDSGAPPFRATFHEEFYQGKFHEPMVGEQVRVRFRGGGEHVEFDRDELRAALDAKASEQREQFEATARAAPGTPAAGLGGQSARLDETREILAAFIRAREAGDEAEAARLKARMQELRGGEGPTGS